MRIQSTVSVLVTMLLLSAFAAGQESLQSQFDWLSLQALDIESHRGKADPAKAVDLSMFSKLDVKAPNNAVADFNKGVALLKKDDSKGAIERLTKAVTIYPQFVSAHMCLGTAYSSVGKQDEARKEYETAIALDGSFPTAYFNLGRVAMMQGDYDAAENALKRGADMQPNANTLTALAYAENANHDYAAAIQTADKVHAMEHKPNAMVHYVAASAYIAQKQYDQAEAQFKLLLAEDPVNPLGPVAKQDIALIERHRQWAAQQAKTASAQSAALRKSMASLDKAPAGCYDCANAAENPPAAATTPATAPPPPEPSLNELTPAGNEGFTMRRTVDEVALFFSALQGNHPVTTLQRGNIQIRDNNQNPEKIIAFRPQSKLPLRLALIIDTSGSVEKRLDFEKQAAIKFVQSMLTGPKDLAFVMGFANRPQVMQDFTANQDKLAQGIHALTDHGGTALWDAISYASWKLAAYPDRDYVARVIVIVSDGEDNSSRLTLRRAIEDADRAAVSIYTVSSRDITNSQQRWSEQGRPTDGDRVLEAIAGRTGGEALFPGAVQNLQRSFTRLHDIIRNRYMVAYKPAGFRADGSYRKVAVDANQEGKRLKVRVRDGYYARTTAY